MMHKGRKEMGGKAARPPRAVACKNETWPDLIRTADVVIGSSQDSSKL